MGERAFMRGAQKYARRTACLKSLPPAGRTQAPSIAGLQTGEPVLYNGCGKIIAAGSREIQKGRRHHGANGMTADVLAAGIAAAVPIKTRHGLQRA